MAKCPKCLARKGKRYCPALDDSICSPCCATHRLKTIACPQDCPYLEAEYYQLARRRERAKSMGRDFLASLKEHFRVDETREFAFKLQADVFWWMRAHGTLTNDATALALDEVKNRLSKIVIASGNTPPLTEFLVDLLESRTRYELVSKSFQRNHQMRAIETLVKHIRALGDPDGSSYHDEIAGYFDQLDFEADLDYSPEDESRKEDSGPAGFRERSSGLIVPDGS